MKDLMIINHRGGPQGVFKSAVSIKGWTHRQLENLDDVSEFLDVVTGSVDMRDQFRVVGMSINPARIGIEASNHLTRRLMQLPLPPHLEIVCLDARPA